MVKMAEHTERVERIRLKDTTCPLIRLDTARRKDKSISFSLSLLLHVAIFSLVGLSLIKAPDFAVDKGENSVEIDLVAAPSEPVPEQAVIEPPPEEPKHEFVEEIKKPVEPPLVQKPVERPRPVIETKGRDKVTVQSAGGAVTESKPDYLRNPAPVYPESARRRGQEGVVLLSVLVDKNGQPRKITVKKSSGVGQLDDAAVKSVWQWTFHAARLGSIPVESNVDIPVRFKLKEK